MAWELRRGQRYYYAARRVGRRVVRTYHGTGEAARDAEHRHLDQIARKNQGKAAIAGLCESLAPIEQLLSDLNAAVSLLTHGTLLAEGYYQHDRTWRRHARQQPTQS